MARYKLERIVKENQKLVKTHMLLYDDMCSKMSDGAPCTVERVLEEAQGELNMIQPPAFGYGRASCPLRLLNVRKRSSESCDAKRLRIKHSLPMLRGRHLSHKSSAPAWPTTHFAHCCYGLSGADERAPRTLLSTRLVTYCLWGDVADVSFANGRLRAAAVL